MARHILFEKMHILTYMGSVNLTLSEIDLSFTFIRTEP